MRIVSFVGWSGTGKTTLIEHLIGELTERSLRVAVIKHDAHRFEIDKEGKDSWRFTKAGAVVSAIVSTEKSAIVETRQLSLFDMVDRIKDVDIILVEGFSGDDLPKIGIFRKASGNSLPDLSFVAVAADAPVPGQQVTLPLSDFGAIADFIMQNPVFVFDRP